jgi:tetratricopeptide (TPR) repeat protein
MPSVSVRILLALVIFAGLAFKVCYLWSYALANPHFNAPWLDSAQYVEWAKSINKDGWLGKEVFYQAPLYPYLLSILFRTFGDTFISIYVVQLIMGTGIVILIYLAARRVYGERAGLFAAIFCIAYAPYTLYETKILSTITEMFLGMSFIYLLVRAEQDKRRIFWIAGSITLGLAIICRPQYLLVVPLILVILLLRHGKEPRSLLAPFAAILLLTSSIVGMVTVRNFVVGHDLVAISSNGGVTFAQGNNLLAGGALKALPGFTGSLATQRQEDMQIAQREAGRPLKPSESSAFWYRKGLGFIRNDPSAYLMLLLNKAALILNNYEVGNVYLVSIDKSLTPVLRLAFMPFGLIMAFAVPGFLLCHRSNSGASALMATFIGSTAALLLFFVCTRYRMTLAPAATVMAGGGLDYLLANLANFRRTVSILIPALLIFILSLSPFFPFSAEEIRNAESDHWMGLAIAYEKNGDPEKALRICEKAIDMSNAQYTGYILKARVLRELNRDKSEILASLQSAGDRMPGISSAYSMLGDQYLAERELEKAASCYSKALELAPGDTGIYRRLGAVLVKLGMYQRGREIVGQGLKASPKDLELQYLYALLCFGQGDKEEALKYLQSVSAINPDYGLVRELLQKIETKAPQ